MWYQQMAMSPDEEALLNFHLNSPDLVTCSAYRIRDDSLRTVFPGVQFLEIWSMSPGTSQSASSTYTLPYRSWIAYELNSNQVLKGGRFGEVAELFSVCDVTLESKDDVRRMAAAFDAFLNPLGQWGPSRTDWQDGVHEYREDGSWVLHSSVAPSMKIVLRVDDNFIVTTAFYDES